MDASSVFARDSESMGRLWNTPLEFVMCGSTMYLEHPVNSAVTEVWRSTYLMYIAPADPSYIFHIASISFALCSARSNSLDQHINVQSVLNVASYTA